MGISETASAGEWGVKKGFHCDLSAWVEGELRRRVALGVEVLASPIFSAAAEECRAVRSEASAKNRHVSAGWTVRKCLCVRQHQQRFGAYARTTAIQVIRGIDSGC